MPGSNYDINFNVIVRGQQALRAMKSEADNLQNSLNQMNRRSSDIRGSSGIGKKDSAFTRTVTQEKIAQLNKEIAKSKPNIAKIEREKARYIKSLEKEPKSYVDVPGSPFITRLGSQEAEERNKKLGEFDKKIQKEKELADYQKGLIRQRDSLQAGIFVKRKNEQLFDIDTAKRLNRIKNSSMDIKDTLRQTKIEQTQEKERIKAASTFAKFKERTILQTQKSNQADATAASKFAEFKRRTLVNNSKQEAQANRNAYIAMMAKVAAFGVLVKLSQKFVKNIQQAAAEVKELRLAEIFSGQKFNGFTQTAFGTDVSVAGNMFLAAQKSPYANEFLKPENMRQLAFFKEMLGQNVEQLVPFITALRNVDETGVSTTEVLLMLSNAMMKSSFEVGSFTPILAQFIPQMKQVGISTKEMIGIMGGLSNLGTAGRALGMAMPAMGIHLVNPSATGKKWYEQFGIIATEEVKKGGMLGLIQKIKSVYDQIVATQGKDRGLQFLKDISPGREHGALLSIMDNIDYIKQMTNEIGNTSQAQAKQNQTSRLTGNLMKEIGANAKNIGTAWWDIVGGSEIFKSVLVSIRDILGSIASVMQDINKNPMMKGAISVGTLALSGFAMTKMMGALLPGILKFAGTKVALGLNSMGAGGALAGLAGLKAAVLPLLGQLGIIAGAVVVLFTIRDMVNEMRRKRGEASAQAYTDYIRLSAKAQQNKGQLSYTDYIAFKKAEDLMVERTQFGKNKGISRLEIKITSDGTMTKTAEYNVEKAIRNTVTNMANMR